MMMNNFLLLYSNEVKGFLSYLFSILVAVTSDLFYSVRTAFIDCFQRYCISS